MRCQHIQCKKKLTLVMEHTNRCHCGNTFCSLHRLPADHSCNADHKEIGRKALKEVLVEVRPEKVIKI